MAAAADFDAAADVTVVRAGIPAVDRATFTGAVAAVHSDEETAAGPRLGGGERGGD